MYDSILNYHKQMSVENTFRKVQRYAELQKTKKDMQHNADLLYRKQALRRMLNVAKELDLAES